MALGEGSRISTWSNLPVPTDSIDLIKRVTLAGNELTRRYVRTRVVSQLNRKIISQSVIEKLSNIIM